jgi:hypothetical protein
MRLIAFIYVISYSDTNCPKSEWGSPQVGKIFRVGGYISAAELQRYGFIV